MDNSDLSDDLAVFENLFKDRFTEKDEVYAKIKTKTLPPPPVIHPWKVKKAWRSNRTWDYSAGRSHRERDGDESRYNDRHQSNRDRSPNRDESRNRYRSDRERSNRNREDTNSFRNQEDRRKSNEHPRRSYDDRN